MYNVKEGQEGQDGLWWAAESLPICVLFAFYLRFICVLIAFSILAHGWAG